MQELFHYPINGKASRSLARREFFKRCQKSPILGGLSDQYGRRPVLLISLFGFGIDYILLGFAPTIGWLFLGRLLAGIMGASFTTASAYIADISTPEKRAQNFGMIGAAFGIGFIISLPNRLLFILLRLLNIVVEGIQLIDSII